VTAAWLSGRSFCAYLLHWLSWAVSCRICLSGRCSGSIHSCTGDAPMGKSDVGNKATRLRDSTYWDEHRLLLSDSVAIPYISHHLGLHRYDLSWRLYPSLLVPYAVRYVGIRKTLTHPDTLLLRPTLLRPWQACIDKRHREQINDLSARVAPREAPVRLGTRQPHTSLSG
jgi:hypothetical protein